jgi:hypothetical protein
VDFACVAQLAGKLIAQSNNARNQCHRDRLIGVPAGVGFRTQCVGHRNLAGQSRLFCGDLAFGQQPRDDVWRRRAQKRFGNLGS